jgi:hypothetical protein
VRFVLLALILLHATSAAADCPSDRTYCFAIHMHVAQTDAGSVASQDWELGELAAANVHFAKLGVGFELATIDSLPATAARIETRDDRDGLGTTLGDGVIDVFVTARLDDLDHRGEEIRGVTWHRKDGRKFIVLSTIGMPQVLAHELGHFFGLPHSSYKRSLMNKRHRTDPPPEDRTFVAPELATMKRELGRLVRAKIVVAISAAG